MFEGLKRKVEKKTEGNEAESTSLTRRKFLQGAGALVGATVLDSYLHPSEAGKKYSDEEWRSALENWHDGHQARMRYEELASLTAHERESIIRHECDIYGRFLRSEYGKKILESGSDEELGLLMGCLPALLPSHTRDTSLDVPYAKWPSVAITNTFDVTGCPTVRDAFHTLEVLKDNFAGNGFQIDESHAITNWHVIQHQVERFCTENSLSVDEVTGGRLSFEEGRDAVIVPIRSGDLMQTPYRPTFDQLKDADIHGRLITMAGVDPDETANDAGVKIRPSVAIRVTSRLLDFLNIEANQQDLKSFLFSLPPGEAKERDDRTMLAQGTSGSPIIMSGGIVGINRACVQTYEIKKKLCRDFGLFHGPDVLNTIIRKKIRYMPPILGKSIY